MSEKQPIQSVPAPLPNYGNTCYMNAALQLIMATPELIEALRKDYSQQTLWTVLIYFLSRPDPRYLYYFISSFKLTCAQFDNVNYQDSLHFWDALMNLVRLPFTDTKLYREFEFNNVEEQLGEYADYCAQRDYSYTTQCLAFYIAESIECQKCRKKTHIITQQEALILGADEAVHNANWMHKIKSWFSKPRFTVADLVQMLLQTHTEPRVCQCGGASKLITRRFLRLPLVLLVIARKMSAGQVLFQEHIELEDVSGAKRRYRATAAVVHHQFMTNHYTATVRRGDAWFLCDDDTISETTFQNAEEAYYCAYYPVV